MQTVIGSSLVPRLAVLATTFALLPVPILIGQEPTGAAGKYILDRSEEYRSTLMKAVHRKNELATAVHEGDMRLAAAKNALLEVQKSNPDVAGRWRKLQIGEFESEANFRSRQKAARTSEKLQWGRQLQAADFAFRRARNSAENLPVLRRELAEAESELRTLSWSVPRLHFTRVIRGENISLPRFNRDSMSFESLEISASGTDDVWRSEGKPPVARVKGVYKRVINVQFDSLDSAREFKDGLKIGEIVCVVAEGLLLTQIESPIQLRERVVKNEAKIFTWENGLIAAVGLGAVALGADPDDLNGLQLRTQYKERVLQAEENMEGIRYHFVMSPDRIAFFKNRSVLEHARVTVVSGHPRVTGLTDDVQPAARILKPGDEITAIGGIEIHDVRMMLSTLKAIKPGRRVEVRFRRPNSATEQRFLAEGGRLLGVRVK